MPEKVSIQEFAKRIKEKYPMYGDIDDVELTNLMIEKYPEYVAQADLKKKEQEEISEPSPEIATEPSGLSVQEQIEEDKKRRKALAKHGRVEREVEREYREAVAPLIEEEPPGTYGYTWDSVKEKLRPSIEAPETYATTVPDPVKEKEPDPEEVATKQVKDIRPVPRLNLDGSTSRAKMIADGNEAFPTLFPKDPENPTNNPEDWFELPRREAKNEARKRGEVFDFDSPEEAQTFARGGVSEVEEPTVLGEYVDAIGTGSARMGAGMARTPSFIYSVFAMPQNAIAEQFGIDWLKATPEGFAKTVGLPDNKLAEYYEGLVEERRAKAKKYDKSITEYFAAGDYANAFRSLGAQVAESAPVTVSLMMGNYAGATPITSTIAGGAVFGAEKKKELDDRIPEASESLKTAHALTHGLFEGIFEQMGVTKLGGMMRDIAAKATKESTKEIAEKGFKQTYLPVARKYMGVAAEESISEAATQFAQNVTDKYWGGQPDLNVMSGVADAAIVGLGASTVYSAGPLTAEMVVTRAARGQIEEMQAEKDLLEEEIKKPEVSPQAKETLAEAAMELNAKMANVVENDKKQWEALPEEAKARSVAIMNRLNEIDESMLDENISDEARSVLKKEEDVLLDEIEEIYVANEDAISEAMSEELKMKAEKLTEEAKEEKAEKEPKKEAEAVKKPEDNEWVEEVADLNDAEAIDSYLSGLKQDLEKEQAKPLLPKEDIAQMQEAVDFLEGRLTELKEPSKAPKEPKAEEPTPKESLAVRIAKIEPDRATGETAARIDYGIQARELNKGLKNIREGKTETAPARNVLAKIREFIEQDEFPIIEGTGGKTTKPRAVTTEEMEALVGVTEEERAAKEKEPEVRGLDRMGRGFEDLAKALGTTPFIMGEQRPDVVKALQDIAIGLAEHTGKKGAELIQAVKDYLKEKGFTGVTDEDIDSVSEEVLGAVPEEKPTEEPRVKEEKPKKEEIEERLETGKERKSDYIKRKAKDLRDTKDFREAVDKQGMYKQQSKEAANRESDKLIKELQDEFGYEDGLRTAFKMVKDGELPAIMFGPMTAKVEMKMKYARMTEEALEVVDWKQEELRRIGRELTSVTMESSPEETISRLLAGLDQGKTEALEQEFKGGQSYAEVIEELTARLREIENAYEKLEKTGAIPEGMVPEPDVKEKTKRSKEIKARAKQLRKEGADELKQYFQDIKKVGLALDPKEQAKRDVQFVGALVKVFKSYVLQFEGNVIAAMEKFKSEAGQYGELRADDIERFRKDIIGQSKDVIEEFKEAKKKQIIEQMLKPEGRETKEQRKARREAAEGILEDFNNKESPEVLSDNLQDMAGFEMISPEDIQEIMDMTEKLSQLSSEGKIELANNAWVALMEKLTGLGLQSRPGHEVAIDLWYTGVLSGLTTVARSIKGSGATTVMHTATRLLSSPTMARFMLHNMAKGASGTLKNYAHVMMTGQTTVQFTDFAPKAPKYTDKLWRTHAKNLNTRDKIAKVIMAAPTFMYRNIVAFDQVLKNAVSESNMALFELSKTDPEKKMSERIEEAQKALTNDRRDEIQEIVDEEVSEMKESGEKVPKGYSNRRFREVQASMRDAELVKHATEEASKAALVGTPEGVLGSIYNTYINAIDIKADHDMLDKSWRLVIKSIFPFIRVSFNWINAGLDYTPLAPLKLLAGAVGFKAANEVWTKDGKRPISSHEKRELMMRGTIGITFASQVMASMFDWDEDEGWKLAPEEDSWIKLYGPLTGNWWENPDVSPDAKPWSLRIRNPFTGEWSDTYKYLDNPIGFALAPFGMMHDEIAFGDLRSAVRGEDPETYRKAGGWILQSIVQGTFTFAMDQSFNQGMKTVSSLLNTKDEKKWTKALENTFMRPTEGFYPALYKQLYNQYKALMGIPEKEAASWTEKPARLTPFTDPIIKNNKYDVFGYPVVRDFDFPFIPDWILKTAKDNQNYREGKPEWELLWKYEEVTVGGFLPPDTYKGYKLTADDRDKFMQNAGNEMKSKVNRNMASLEKLDAIQLQKRLIKYKRAAAKKAKGKINK